MKRVVVSALVCVVTLCGVRAFADEAPANPTMSDHQILADCMEKQKTAGVTLSKAQMKRVCKDELKKQKATGSMPTPPSDAPRN